MTLTAYFKRSNPEELRIALLSRRMAKPLWQPFILNRNATILSQDVRDYHLWLAKKTEQAILDTPARASRHESYQDLRRRLLDAHDVARRKARLERREAAVWDLWREIFAAGREFLSAADTERLEREKWYSPALEERPSPGPVLSSYCADIEQVMDLIDWAYRDAIGEHERVHANIQIDTKKIAAPSQQTNTVENQIDLISGQVNMDIADSPYNPYPDEAVGRSRRVTIHLPFPCGLHTALGLEGVLAHELGVHLYEQLLNPRGPLSRGRRLGFAEGFMDMTITRLLRDAVHSQNGVERSVAEHVYQGAQKRFDDRLFLDAPSLLKSEQRANWRHEITAGRRFYENLVKLGSALTAEDRLGATEEAWVRRIALRLNVLDLGPEHREALMLGGNMVLDPWPPGFPLDDKPSATRLLAVTLSDLGAETDLEDASALLRAFIADTSGFVEHLP